MTNTTSNTENPERTTREGINRVVICFDRDWTVSVNPHPEKQSVPLSWVARLAHGNPEVDVWATGNQMLTVEASIHGTSYAASLWRHIHQRYPSEVYPNERIEYYKPAREDRLRAIQDCYERFHDRQDLTLIVVDDADLSAMEDEGWNYYPSWEFVPAALDGKFDFFEPDPVDGPKQESPVDHRLNIDTMDESVSLPKPSEHSKDGCESHYELMSKAVEKIR